MSTESSDQVLDLEAIANLRSLGDEGDDSFLREILAIYIEDVPLRLADLRTALARADQPFFNRSAHTIKGSSSNVGAREVKVLAEKLEHRSKAEPIETLAPQLAELDLAFGRARVALSSYLA
jgi:HPt (histidine-containing phosphotransfer) domain-containing protein